MHKDLLSERNGNIFHSLYKVRRLSTGANMQVGCIAGGRTTWKLFSEGVYFPEKQEVKLLTQRQDCAKRLEV